MTTTTMATATTLPAPCLSVQGQPVYPAALITPEAYEAAWKARVSGARVLSKSYYFAHYVSTFVESDCGVEIEVSALVDLHPSPRATTVDDYRCRVAPEGPEVELSEKTLAGLAQDLISAAAECSR